MTKNILKALIEVSEKAANIARLCREDEVLFSLLIEEKKPGEANPRFIHDFKTVADVLIQETVRHDIGLLFPELRENIKGEEAPQMTCGDGNVVNVKVYGSVEETAEVLAKIFNDVVAANVLADEVHRQIFPLCVDTNDLPDVSQIETKNLGLWIDPIDATAEYIKATYEASQNADIPANGLQCVTVLIGLYDINTNAPVIGVVNQPFAETRTDGGYIGKTFWGISTESMKLTNVPEIGSSAKPVAILSPSEDAKYIEALESLGFEIVFSAGAGHKLLNVVTGAASVYLLSKATTFKWDTCGPQAILNSLGGVLVNLKEMLKTNQIVEVNYETGRGIANNGGILAVRNREALESVLRALKKAQ